MSPRSARVPKRRSSPATAGLALPVGEATVDKQVDAGAETGGIAEQENGRTDQFVDGRHPAERRIGLERLDLFGDLRAQVHGRCRVARTDRSSRTPRCAHSIARLRLRWITAAFEAL